MKKQMKMLLGIILAFLMMLSPLSVLASGGESEYITITVDATDDNGNLQYAIDKPENFSSTNTFTIPAGSSHTIYVKDAAGNITSREYSPSGNSSTVVSSQTLTEDSGTYEVTTGSGDQEINIELELGMDADGVGAAGSSQTTASFSGDYENYEYLTDTVIETPTTTIQNKTTTDGSDTAKKVFYTFTTAEGDPFYLVIDQGNSNTVHLLNTVTREDLKALTEADESSAASEETEDNLLTALNAGKVNSNEAVVSEEKESGSDLVLILVIVAVGIGGYYYFKIYKKKKEEAIDAMDAMDMDEFAIEDDDEEEEIEFDDDEKQQMLDELIAMDEMEETPEEEELLQQDPDKFMAESEEDTHISQNGEAAWEETKIEEENFTNEEIAEAISAAEAFDEELDGEEE